MNNIIDTEIPTRLAPEYASAQKKAEPGSSSRRNGCPANLNSKEQVTIKSIEGTSQKKEKGVVSNQDVTDTSKINRVTYAFYVNGGKCGTIIAEFKKHPGRDLELRYDSKMGPSAEYKPIDPKEIQLSAGTAYEKAKVATITWMPPLTMNRILREGRFDKLTLLKPHDGKPPVYVFESTSAVQAANISAIDTPAKRLIHGKTLGT